MEQVTEFIAESKGKIETQDFPTARELLRKALQIDTSNAEARTLLEKVNAELRRIKLLPQVKERLEKAQSLLLAGHLQEAKVEAEAALRLDSSFEPARDALRQVLEAVERNRLFQERLRDSQQHLAKGALAEAEQQLEQALELNPASPQAQQLKKEILRERERQEKGTRLREMMHRARGLWKQQKFTQCLALLDALRSEFPSEAEVVKLREAVREDQAEQQKQQKLAEAGRCSPPSGSSNAWHSLISCRKTSRARPRPPGCATPYRKSRLSSKSSRNWLRHGACWQKSGSTSARLCCWSCRRDSLTSPKSLGGLRPFAKRRPSNRSSRNWPRRGACWPKSALSLAWSCWRMSTSNFPARRKSPSCSRPCARLKPSSKSSKNSPEREACWPSSALPNRWLFWMPCWNSTPTIRPRASFTKSRSRSTKSRSDSPGCSRNARL